MTTTTREELLELLKAILPPDPVEHTAYCGFCGHPEGHSHVCQWLLASNLCAAHEAGELEFEDEDDDGEMTDADWEKYFTEQDKLIPWHRNYREGRALIRGVSLTTDYEIGRCLRVSDNGPTWAYLDHGIWRPVESENREVCYIDELPRKAGE